MSPELFPQNSPVVYTVREGVIRLISARRARRNERQSYQISSDTAPKAGRTDWARVREMDDTKIDAAVAGDKDSYIGRKFRILPEFILA